MAVMRIVRIGALAACAFVLAGCGAQDDAQRAAGAEIVPAAAPVFVSIDSDLSSGQWDQVAELVRKFPAGDDAISSLESSLKNEAGLTYDADVEPALGDEVDVVWLDFENEGENFVAMTQPEDEAAFARLIAKGNESSDDDLVCEELDAWQVCALERATIARFRQQSSGDKLVDDETFNDALDELPDDALVHAYVRGQSIIDALEDFQVPGSTMPFSTEQGIDFLSLGLKAEGSGLRLVGAGRASAEPEQQVEAFESQLLEVVPADAVAFLAFKGGDTYAKQQRELEKNPAYRMGLRELERMLGMPLSSLLELFENEVGLYVRPGTPIPEVTLLIEAPNEQAALAQVNTAVENLTKSIPTKPCQAPGEEAGVEVQCVDLGEVELRTAAVDGKVVVTIGQGAIAKLMGDGDKLADDEGFEDARDAAGMPAESVGFMWLDLEDGIPMIMGLSTASGGSIPAEIRENLEPLGSFLAWADSDGRSGSFTAFLEID
jgi:hypothetical protein